jgi:hypothetical protein
LSGAVHDERLAIDLNRPPLPERTPKTAWIVSSTTIVRELRLIAA